jgi:hypothetical protein
VPASEIQALNLAPAISNCSLRSKDYYYLEGDMDAGTFLYVSALHGHEVVWDSDQVHPISLRNVHQRIPGLQPCHYPLDQPFTIDLHITCAIIEQAQEHKLHWNPFILAMHHQLPTWRVHIGTNNHILLNAPTYQQAKYARRLTEIPLTLRQWLYAQETSQKLYALTVDLHFPPATAIS